ncbi:MAG: hypothetical protein AAB527_03510, partial [Patescibacteria group bacterium]
AFVIEKRIIFATILALTLVISGFWFFNKSRDEKTAMNSEQSVVATTKSTVESPDSDNDGLKDWEETLWGTNPDSADTDNDGILDGEEIKNNEPSVPAPKQEPIQEDNLTQKTSRELFVSYIQQRQAGLDPKTAIDQILGTILDDSESSGFKNNFSQKNLRLASDNSTEEARAYINNLAKISDDGASKIKENELTTLKRLIQQANSSDSFEKFDEFAVNAAAYKEMVASILKIAVPQNYIGPHLKYLNALNNLAKINSAFSVFMSDPISGMGAAKQYLDEAENIKRSLITLSVVAYSDRLTFGPNEYGFALLSLINQLQ